MASLIEVLTIQEEEEILNNEDGVYEDFFQQVS